MVVKVGDLDKASTDGATVDQAALKKAGLANGPADGVRILGMGELSKRLVVKAHGFSKSAAAKIAAHGGTTELIPGPKKPKKNKMKPRPAKENCFLGLSFSVRRGNMRTPNVTRGKRGFLLGRFSLSSAVPLSRMLLRTISATS